MKPCLLVANLSEAELKGGILYAALKALAAARNCRWYPSWGPGSRAPGFLSRRAPGISGRFGSYRTRHGALVRESSRLLGLVTFYTIVAPKYGLFVPAGTTAPKAAGQVHSEMEKGFIRLK